MVLCFGVRGVTHAASHGAGSLLGRGMRRTHLGKQNLLALLQLLGELAERGADLSLRKRNENGQRAP